ncbi:hypothetical protein LPJ61_000765 [Coemansia biformis]|uniref:Uncharacterized protein n=1 Tax=Coemansia biformis TaxID=1286918 RepID=A0A9W7YI29_9FUNG|nr:hypothetical protein LPJ61_000765 [Coemansia biformis]
MHSLYASIALALLVLLQTVNAWYIQIGNKTMFATFQQYRAGCYRPPRWFEGPINEIYYVGKMIYVYESKNCSGYPTVSSKTHTGWTNVYHPVRSYRLLDENY